MFGEYESESPRVPSPWDSLISSPRSLSPSKLVCQPSGNLALDSNSSSLSLRRLSPSPLLLPRLVPENDSGNIEYKLQLLNPSPARFARLVTQLKWRLLEGGGQAYYELGVADSGDLVGLGREELESSLDTLEMMAGEIGASVIVVKEIEVPAELAARYEEDVFNNSQFNSWGGVRGKRPRRGDRGRINLHLDDGDSVDVSAFTNTETEEDFGTTDDGKNEDMKMTVVLEGPVNSHDAMADLTDAMAVFSMDSELESDLAETGDISEIDDDNLTPSPPQYAVDLEISSVYKPRPMRKRFHHIYPASHHHHSNGQQRSGGKGGKKGSEKLRLHHAQNESLSSDSNSTLVNPNKSLTRRQARDRRREDRKQVLFALAARDIVEASPREPAPGGEIDNSFHRGSTETSNRMQAETDTLVEELEALHVAVGQTMLMSNASESIATSLTSDCTTPAATTGITSIVATINNTNNPKTVDSRNEDEDDIFVSPTIVSGDAEIEKEGMRLIVEVLVVRKMSIEEGYLDFEGFSFT